MIERSAQRGIFHDLQTQFLQSGIRRQGNAQRQCFAAFQFYRNQFSDTFGPIIVRIVHRFLREGDNQLSQQGRDAQYFHFSLSDRSDVERSHLDFTVHLDTVFLSGRHQERPVWWYDPARVSRSDTHDAGNGIKQLIALVTMRCNYMAILKHLWQDGHRLGKVLVVVGIRAA